MRLEWEGEFVPLNMSRCFIAKPRTLCPGYLALLVFLLNKLYLSLGFATGLFSLLKYLCKFSSWRSFKYSQWVNINEGTLRWKETLQDSGTFNPIDTSVYLDLQSHFKLMLDVFCYFEWNVAVSQKHERWLAGKAGIGQPALSLSFSLAKRKHKRIHKRN